METFTENNLDNGYEKFEHEFEILTGIRLGLYKENQMKRRINTLIQRKGLSGYDSFIERLSADSSELASFLDYITINVTEFFRTPEHWESFEKTVLPEFENRTDRTIKIWSCACSTGEEAYSLVISMLNCLKYPRFHIIASDVDDKVLEIAKRGTYTEKSTEKLSEEIIKKYFVHENNAMRISEELKSYVEFVKLDLLKDEYPAECDIIVCRNVLIYFTEEAKTMIYGRFSDNLNPGGYLFTGNTEQIIHYKELEFNKISNFLYQKK